MKDVNDIQYEGRKARRRGSEQRRQAILEASLRIIIKDGIRAVRHRAVAREADVPLSATTYYFKDIPALIVDTFTFFAERAINDVIAPFRDNAFSLLEQAQEMAEGSPNQRDLLLDQLSQATAEFIHGEVYEQRDHLVAEQAFYAEAIIQPKLAELATLYIDQQRQALSDACRLMHTLEPDEDGEILMAVIYRLERQMLMDSLFTTERAAARLRRTLGMLVPATDAPEQLA